MSAQTDKFEELMKEAYMSTISIYASARNKWNICKERKAISQSSRKEVTQGTTEYKDFGRQSSHWGKLQMLTERMWKWITVDAGDVGGIARKAEMILTNLGLTKEIKDFEDYNDVRTAGPLSFDTIPDADITKKVSTWSADDDALRKVTEPWYLQWEVIFDSLLYDSYKFSGACEYYREAVDAIPRSKLPTTGKWPYTLALFDAIIGSGEGYLHYGRACLAGGEMQMREYISPGHDDYEKNLLRRAEYFRRGPMTLSCKGGLWLINYDDLTKEQQSHVEGAPITFEEPV